MSARNLNGNKRGTVGTLIGGAIIGGVPWVLMHFVKSGDLGADMAVSTATFLGVVSGAAVQWWVSHK